MSFFTRLAASPSKTFFAATIAVLLSAGLAAPFRGFPVLIYFWSILFVAAVGLLVRYFKTPRRRFILFCLLGFLLGVWRAAAVGGETSAAVPISKTAFFDGVVASDPEIMLAGERFMVRSGEYGRVAVSLRDNHPIYYGDRVRVRCELQDAARVPAPYRNALLVKRASFSCGAGALVSVTFRGGGLRRALFAAKRKFIFALARLLPEPHAALAAGVILGNTGALDKETTETFRRTGTAHIIAVSGYNISVVYRMIFGVLLFVLLPRRLAFLTALLAVTAFVVVTGAEASVVRAAIMGTLVYLAKEVGRPSQTATSLVFAAALMVLWNPYLLAFDVGFQLSFAATLGLVVLAPKLTEKFARLPDIFSVRRTFSETVAATVFTLPVSLWHFGGASLLSPLVNVLILWAVPLLMAGAFAAGLIELISAPLAVFAAPLVWGLAEWILRVTAIFSRIPFISVSRTVFLTLAAAFAVCLAGIKSARYLGARRQKQPLASYEITVE